MISIQPLVLFTVPSSEGAFPSFVLCTVLVTDHDRPLSFLCSVLLIGGVRPLIVSGFVRTWTEDDLER